MNLKSHPPIVFFWHLMFDWHNCHRKQRNIRTTIESKEQEGQKNTKDSNGNGNEREQKIKRVRKEEETRTLNKGVLQYLQSPGKEQRRTLNNSKILPLMNHTPSKEKMISAKVQICF